MAQTRGQEGGAATSGPALDGAAGPSVVLPPAVEWFVPLTPLCTPEDARRALAALASLRVTSHVGLRWRSAIVLVVMLGGAGLLVVAIVASARGAGWPVVVWLAFTLVTCVTAIVESRLVRSYPRPHEPHPGPRGPFGAYVAAWRPDASTAPAPAWPPGSEALALLATASRTRSLHRAWLLDRTRLAEDAGGAWVAWLGAGRLVTVGLPLPGLRRLMPLVEITWWGRQVLEAEVSRLERLAASA